jgi:hypothetical protein
MADNNHLTPTPSVATTVSSTTTTTTHGPRSVTTHTSAGPQQTTTSHSSDGPQQTTTTSHSSDGPQQTTTTSHSSDGPQQTTTTTHTSGSPDTTVVSSTPQSTTYTHPTVTTTLQLPVQPYRAPAASVGTQANLRPPSIRIRRQGNDQGTQASAADISRATSNRRRASSDPQPPHSTPAQDDLAIRRQVSAMPLQTLQEEGDAAETKHFGPLEPVENVDSVAPPPSSARRPGYGRGFSVQSFRERRQDKAAQEPVVEQPLYDARMIDMLDVIGTFAMVLPQHVSTNNVQILKLQPSTPSTTSKTLSSFPISDGCTVVNQPTISRTHRRTRPTRRTK